MSLAGEGVVRCSLKAGCEGSPCPCSTGTRAALQARAPPERAARGPRRATLSWTSTLRVWTWPDSPLT